MPRFRILTVRSPREHAFDPMEAARAYVAHDVWPVAPHEANKVRAGDQVFLHAAGVGLVGDACVATDRRPWSESEHRALGAALHRQGGSSGGVLLSASRLWSEELPLHDVLPLISTLSHRRERRLTHDVETIAESDWRAVHQARARIGWPWQPVPCMDFEGDRWGWLVVEEVFDETASIELSRWPRVHDGRLTFPTDSRLLHVDRRSLDQAAGRRGVLAPQAAAVGAGTALAVQVAWERLAEGEEADARSSVELDALRMEVLLDITAAAREQAQIAFYEEIVGSASAEEIAELRLEDRGGEEDER